MKRKMTEIQTLYELNRLEEAEEKAIAALKDVKAMEEAVAAPELNHLKAGLHFWLGKIYYRKQEWGNAINQFQLVLDTDPAYQGAREQIQMINAILGYYTPDMFNP